MRSHIAMSIAPMTESATPLLPYLTLPQYILSQFPACPLLLGKSSTNLDPKCFHQNHWRFPVPGMERDKKLAALYNERYPQFRKLYPACRELFAQIL